MTADVSFWEARGRAIARCLDADDSIVIVGDSTSGGFNPDDGIASRYPDRFVRPPISEFATLGMSVGAACAGLRPAVFVGTSTFTYYGWSAIVNEVPHIRYLSGGKVTAPMVVHMHSGARRAGGAQHEQTPQAMLQNVPGLVIYTPATPQSIYDAVRSALTGDDPVVIADHVLLGEVTGPLDEDGPVPIDPVETLRAGADGLVVATSLMSQRALDAADQLARQGGPSLSVVNITTIAPSPWRDVAALVAAHPFCMFVDESRGPGSPASYLLARAAEAVPGARLRLLCTADAPSPFSTELLDEVVPTVEHIANTLAAAAEEFN